ncbi:hypothetical protein Pan216_45000 [Planctomycetes bacterium Pan216]|uniref:HPP transmembrane region domain-containing protein n=1 Tax=Kolteria novifilia TaxID=2527975 RepID=A0A518B9H8_9BACT|nr:hypothetical protein Pan216_45000 [Planctomycetes bacterium Pan216]
MSGLVHIIENLDRVSDSIATEIDSVEKRNPWFGGIINGLVAGGAVGFVAWATRHAHHESAILLFGCLGSSSAAIVMAPLARVNSLRSVSIAYLIACAVSLAYYPLREFHQSLLPLHCFLIVTTAVVLARLLDAMHPSAVGAALAFVIYQRSLGTLVILFLMIECVLILIKVFAYLIMKDLHFRDFAKEFRREYYGKEILVSIAQAPAEPTKDSSS